MTLQKGKEFLISFFKNNFEITSTKVSKIVGAVLSGVLLLTVILDYKAYTSQEFKQKWILLASVLVFPFIIGLVTAYKIEIKNKTCRKILYLASIFLLPVISITMTECLNEVFIYNMTYLGFLGNYIVVLIMYFLVMAFTGSIKISILVVNPVLFGFGVAHSYLMDFRGTPFLPMDFLSISTAVGVANTYAYTLTYKIMTALLIFIFLIVIAIKSKAPDFKILTKVISRTVMCTFSAVLLILFYGTNVFTDRGVKPDFWNQTRGYHNYGFVLNFFCNTKYLHMSVPSGYNPDDVDNFVSENVDSANKNTSAPVPNAPNVICIMNESLADLGVLGTLETNEDCMPFMHSLTENTIKGNLYVPVIGAGTSNTEFEFLTGHSVAFLPSGSNAYMLYVNHPIASLVSTLEGQGYSSYALHPYFAAGWRRTAVYQNLGFNKFVSLEDIMDVSLMDQYQENGSDPNYLQQLVEEAYPGRNMLIRQYVSDSYDFKLLIDDFEQRDRTMPYFAFNVTMQNHGGYTMGCVNFDESIYATNVSEAYNKANKYLSLVKASDNAFKELIEYFSNVNEPTVICMFGDHQPSVETAFISEVMGVSDLSNLTPEQNQARHITPFIIWANYDIEEQVIDKISSNYLSSLVLKTAGLKLTEYNKYLLKLYESVPVVDTVGYIDKDNNYYKWSDVSPYTDMLNEYEKVQYNNIFDRENRKNEIFYLEGYDVSTQLENYESSGEEAE